MTHTQKGKLFSSSRSITWSCNSRCSIINLFSCRKSWFFSFTSSNHLFISSFEFDRPNRINFSRFLVRHSENGIKLGVNWRWGEDEGEDEGEIWVTYQSRQILFQFQSVWLQLLLDFVELIGPWAVEREQTEQTRSLKVISVHFATLIPTKMSPQKSPEV